MHLVEKFVLATCLLASREGNAHYINVPYLGNGQITPFAWHPIVQDAALASWDGGRSTETLEDVSGESHVTYLQTQPQFYYTTHHVVPQYIPQVVVPLPAVPQPPVPHHPPPRPDPEDSPENSEEQKPIRPWISTKGGKGDVPEGHGVKGSPKGGRNPSAGGSTASSNGPNDDGSYDFMFKTDDQSRTESKDAQGNVQGSWNYKGAGGHTVDVTFRSEHGKKAVGDGGKGGQKTIPPQESEKPVWSPRSHPWARDGATKATKQPTPPENELDTAGDMTYKYEFKTDTFSKAESSDKDGNVEGMYTYVDGAGKERTVTYTARNGEGFVPKGDIQPAEGEEGNVQKEVTGGDEGTQEEEESTQTQQKEEEVEEEEEESTQTQSQGKDEGKQVDEEEEGAQEEQSTQTEEEESTQGTLQEDIGGSKGRTKGGLKGDDVPEGDQRSHGRTSRGKLFPRLNTI